eukprot:4844517-Amphidinium_carterae.1
MAKLALRRDALLFRQSNEAAARHQARLAQDPKSVEWHAVPPRRRDGLGRARWEAPARLLDWAGGTSDVRSE